MGSPRMQDPPRAVNTPDPRRHWRTSTDYGMPTDEKSYKVGALWRNVK